MFISYVLISSIFSAAMTKIVESLENLIKLTPYVQSILILDKDGVPVVSAGEEIRNRGQYSFSYNTLVEQARKLGMGSQKFWIFMYEMNQVCKRKFKKFKQIKVVLLNIGQFAVFILASSNANTGILCTLHVQLEPILGEIEQVVNEVMHGQTTTIIGQSPTRHWESTFIVFDLTFKLNKFLFFLFFMIIDRMCDI